MSIRLFGTPGCPFSQAAREFFNDAHLEFTDHDVTADPTALIEMKKISGGARNVPVIVIDDDVFIGFDREKIANAVASAGKKSGPAA